MGDGRSAPSGVVTFVFTDVESSTRLWAADPAAMSASLQVHDRIVPDHLDVTFCGDSQVGPRFLRRPVVPQCCALGVVTVSVIERLVWGGRGSVGLS